MTRTHRIFPIFATQEEVDEVKRLTGLDMPTALKRALEYMVYYKIVKRCIECDKEVELLIPKDQSKCTLSIEHFERPICNKCNPKSKWRRVEDVE